MKKNCPRCRHATNFKPGIAIDNPIGRFNSNGTVTLAKHVPDGCTVYPIHTGVITPVLKCSKCGHSIAA